jgi:YD repeat-containing protein
MTDVSDGTEAVFTEYIYQIAGSLSDSPQFTERHEWWQGKTDDSGTLQDLTHPAISTYGRTANNSSNWVIAPNGVKIESVSNSNAASSQFGLVSTQRMIRVSDGAVLEQSDFTYNDRTSTTGLQRTSVITTDDAGNQAKTLSTFGQYGRLIELKEYGFPIGGAFKPRRITDYTYVDDVNYISLCLRQLVTDISVYDAKGTAATTDDKLIARTGFTYDTPDTGWEIQTYGFTQNCSPSTTPGCSPPPGFATSKINRVQRGNLNKLQLWTDATAATAQVNFRRQFDIFGNQLKTDVSCCSLKRFTFSPDIAGMYYSLPMSATDGPTSGPNLTTGFAYDFNTSFLNSQTDANDLVTSYAPDAAIRLRTVTFPKLGNDANANPALETFYADAENNPSINDTLVYQGRLTYFDGTTQRVQISNRWIDGAGRTVRAGSAAGPTISSFDAVKSIYDDLGRLRKSINPYNTANSDGDTTGLLNATVYDYDELSRVKNVTLPDANTVTTSYNGPITTVTDQVGRQRQSEADGLGRVIGVTEMDNSKQLTWTTTYGYDMNDNLTSVNQGGQTRAFSYDSLSRMTFERTPEQDATIDDGSGTFWSAKNTYTDFNAVLTRQDARGVVTTYGYDGLNRLSSVSYTTTGTTAQATSSVSVTYGSAVPKIGQIEEIKQTDSQNIVPWKEDYAYDSLSRVSSKTV